jgi:DNA-binding PadR family transcriptional regulator
MNGEGDSLNQHAAAAHRRRPSERPRIREAVLGLLSERPCSAPALSIRLAERVRAAELPDNYVYWVLEGLEREGLVTRVPFEQAAAEGDTSSGPRNARYQATAKGVEHFKQWLVSPSIEPALRDELMIRIAFCGPAEVPRLIELVYGQEQACLGRIEELKTAAEQAQTSAPDAGEEAAWQRMLRTMGRDAELAHWSARVEWLQSVREMLEELARKSALR